MLLFFWTIILNFYACSEPLIRFWYLDYLILAWKLWIFSLWYKEHTVHWLVRTVLHVLVFSSWSCKFLIRFWVSKYMNLVLFPSNFHFWSCGDGQNICLWKYLQWDQRSFRFLGLLIIQLLDKSILFSNSGPPWGIPLLMNSYKIFVDYFG